MCGGDHTPELSTGRGYQDVEGKESYESGKYVKKKWLGQDGAEKEGRKGKSILHSQEGCGKHGHPTVVGGRKDKRLSASRAEGKTLLARTKKKQHGRLGKKKG